jgi:pimeloyl-ACP methyl ester carboxylesterase
MLARQTVAELRVLKIDDHHSLAKIEVPTLIVHGARSSTSLEDLHKVADTIPDATLVDIPDAGHAVHLDNPAGLLAALRRFL